MSLAVFFWYFTDESTRNIARVGTKAIAFVCTGDEESFLRARHGYIPESSLLFEFIWFKKRTRVWKKPLFRTSDDDVIKLESFCAMSGHKEHLFLIVVIVLLCSDECDVLEKMHQ